MQTRRQFMHLIARAGTAVGLSALATSCRSMDVSTTAAVASFDLVVIGTGFGGSLTALSIANQLDRIWADPTNRPKGHPPKILLLERGTWWTTPVETVQDKTVATRAFLLWKKHPTQEWSALNDARGALDLLLRCRRTASRPEGLFEFSPIGARGLFDSHNDGVSVLRASGVGGGSLVYSNITIRPPESLFEDPRWPGRWARLDGTGGAIPANASTRDEYYTVARNAIGYSVEYALERRRQSPDPARLGDPSLKVNTGLSNIVTRSARLKPAWTIVDDITGVNGKVRRVTVASPPPASYPPELIDRTRIFQNAIAQLQPDGWGTVDLAINDVIPEGEEARTEPRARNYCERQGRCNIGCLPGARHTLNKQLMRAVFGNFRAADFDPQAPKDPPPVLKQVSVELWPLTEVDSISLRSGGGYRVKCRRRSAAEPTAAETVVVEATRVIVAAGCLGTTELMLRAREQGRSSGDGMGLPDLSEKVGFGFSPNGDYLAFLDGTRERVNLTRGPVTTSFGHFNANSPKADGFHNIEDQGIPRSLAALIGYGMPVIQGLFRGHETLLKLPGTFLGIFGALRNLFSPYPKRRTLPTQPEDLSGHRPDSEDEFTASMMCIAAQGKDQANGQFRLERDRLRVRRTDGRSFAEDPIYRTLRATLARLAEKLRPSGSAAEFISPFTDVALGDQPPVIGTSHPLGGCPMGRDISEGVVDEFGRVFRAKRATTPASSDFYPGLYIADATVIPTALGVNPSLTISAIALRVADNIVAEWETIGVR